MIAGEAAPEPGTTAEVVPGFVTSGCGYGDRVRTCDFCGRQEDDATAALTWSSATERGRTRTFCGACSREHLRSMEGKLDSEHW